MICVASPPSRAPVPCVPVDTAPDSVCRSMSPRFAIARPNASSAVFSRASGVPAPTTMRPDSWSPAAIDDSPSSRTCTWSATAQPVNECPVPTALIRRP
jgi:hypothetical protein